MRWLLHNCIPSITTKLLVCYVGFSLCGLLQGMYQNMPADEVLAEKGTPKNTLARGTSELWVYEDGTSLRFEGGLLISCDRCVLLEAPEALPEIPKSPTTPAEPLTEATPVEKKELVEKELAEESQWLEDGEYAYEDEYDLAGMEDDYSSWDDEPSEANFLVIFLIGTTALSSVLWLAFKQVSIGFVARQVLVIAVGVNLFRLLLDLIPWQDENRQFFYVDDVILLSVLVSLIYFLSEVKTTLTALKIAVAATVIAKIIIFGILWAAIMIGGSFLS